MSLLSGQIERLMGCTHTHVTLIGFICLYELEAHCYEDQMRVCLKKEKDKWNLEGIFDLEKEKM